MELTGLGSCKGVMLCNRPPTNNSTTPSWYSSTSETTTTCDPYYNRSNQNPLSSSSFLCGTVSKPWGSNVIISEKSRVLSRLSKHGGAVSRHKLWLKDMQEQRDRRKREKEEEMKVKEERKQEFMKNQAEKRRRAREEVEEKDEEEEYDYGQEQCCTIEEPVIESCVSNVQSQHSPDSLKLSAKSSLKQQSDTQSYLQSGEKRSRPVWSLTEKGARQVQDQSEAIEENELMSFVEGLDQDFDQYYGDMELKLLMSQVSDRIKILEKERDVDESRLQTVMDNENSTLKNEKFNKGPLIDISQKEQYGAIHEGEYKAEEDDIQSIAATVRSEYNGSVSSIHSRKSMQMLISKSRDRLMKEQDERDCALEPVVEDEFNSSGGMKPPVTITHTEDDGARIAATKSLNKLPFKNRNPAL